MFKRRRQQPKVRRQEMGPRRRWAIAALLGLGVFVTSAAYGWHIFIFETQRSGRIPCEPGRGWEVEFYYNIPDANAANLLTAEAYVADREPTFTFKADYIDWPAGLNLTKQDKKLKKLEDFFDGHVSEVSVPGAMTWPIANFLFKARGDLEVSLDFSRLPDPPPVWLDFGLMAYDGGRVQVGGTTMFRIIVPLEPESFFFEDIIATAPGAYEVTITYFERFDPDNLVDMDQAGVELVTCHQDGLDVGASALLFCGDLGSAKSPPPWRVWPRSMILPIAPGDFDVDGDVDLEDVRWIQECFTGPGAGGPMREGCQVYDLDRDFDVDLEDTKLIIPNLTGPMRCEP